MSKYENYSEVSKSYDKDRNAFGADIIAGILQVHGSKQLKDVHLLDAGCGTGNYAKALVGYGVGKVTLLDGNAAMLNAAEVKMKAAFDDSIVDQVVEAKLPSMPFEDKRFDAVLFSLVLHHLEANGNGVEFPTIEKTFREAKRVLRPNGVMIIAANLPPAIKETVWYYKLNTDLTERLSKVYPSLQQYKAMFDKTGFKMITKLSLLGTEIFPNYFDYEGPLRKDWRNGDSLFGYATEQEICEIEAKVKEMIDNGTIRKFVEEQDRASEIGIVSLIACMME